MARDLCRATGDEKGRKDRGENAAMMMRKSRILESRARCISPDLHLCVYPLIRGIARQHTFNPTEMRTLGEVALGCDR